MGLFYRIPPVIHLTPPDAPESILSEFPAVDGSSCRHSPRERRTAYSAPVVRSPRYSPRVTPDLTTIPLPPRSRSDRTPRWEVRFEGELIGTIEEKKIGRSSSRFFQGFVLIGDRSLNIELNIDFEERCEAILEAWRDPASNVHTRYALRLPDPS